jgi:nickel-dependent lactate racemase
MRIDVPYGKGHVTVDIEETCFVGAIGLNEVDIVDEDETLTRALEHPVNSGSFSSFLAGVDNVMVIVNDRTRPTPTARILELIYPQIKDVRRLEFIVATGVHRAPTESEYREILGDLYEEYRERIVAHDARRSTDMVHVGRSKSGTELYVNGRVTEAERVIVIGSVEPHYFAGYTGGRKALLPGVASYETIEQNHKLALLKDAQSLVLDGNPVHEDMVDAIKHIRGGDIFCIMTVLDRHHRIYAAAAGDINGSFNAMIAPALEVFSVEIQGKADIVVAVAPRPMDIDLYQSQKAIENGKLALKDGGILILVAQCRDGIGEDTFVKLLSAFPDPSDVLREIDKRYKLGYHKAARLAETAKWAEMWVVSDLAPTALDSVFLRSFSNLQSAIDEAIGIKGSDASILFLMAASMTVPRVV